MPNGSVERNGRVTRTSSLISLLTAERLLTLDLTAETPLSMHITHAHILLTQDQHPAHDWHSDLGLHCREACQAQNTSDCGACAHSLPLLGRPHVHLQAERPRGTIPRVQCTCVLLHALQHGLPILGTPCVHVSVEKHRSSIP